MTGSRGAAVQTSVVVCLLLGAAFLSAQAPPQPAGGRARVLVQLRMPGAYVPEGRMPNAAAVAAQRRAIDAAAARLLAGLNPADHRLVRRYQTVPVIALEADPAALAALNRSPDVVRVFDDEILRPVLAQSVPLVQGDQAWAAGYDGAGTTIAVLDTGVDAHHPFLAGKVIDEACFSSTVPGTSQSACPDGSDLQLGPGAAAPCSLADCVHGTHVAGIAAGNGATGGVSFSGVARNARLIAVQVFSVIVDPRSCGGIAPCAGAFSSDIIAGLEYAYGEAAPLNVVAVNMSLGGATFNAPCDDQPYKPAIDNLRSIGVASVIASGNDGYGNAIASPGCISSAVSVGSIDKSNQVSYFSNVAPFLSLFAPGESIHSSVPGGGFADLSGTSMATPHVAGAWAVMRQAVPGASVGTILAALRGTGRPITDTRLFGGGSTVPRISIFEALASLVPVTNPSPVLTSVTPARLRAGTSPVTMTLSGSGFDAFSVAYWNGVPKPTTVVNMTQLQAEIAPADLAAGPTAQVTVVTPAPGGGTSAPLTVPIDPPPSLTPGTLSAAPSSRVTVTLANGFGGAADWLAFASSGSSNTSYLTFTYVGTGVTDRTWTVTMPSTPGTYEFRLFLNNGYTRAATSATVTVDAALNPAPSIASLAPASVPAGSPGFTLTVNGTGFVSSSVVKWNGAARATTFVSATQLRAAIAAGDIGTVGQALVAVEVPPPGGGPAHPAQVTGTPPALLAVSATTVAPGASVTATLTNGAGGLGDWLALASTASANTSYVTFTYVGGGVTTRTWTVTVPSTPGPYEFRLFLNNGYTRAATSPVVTVSPGINGVPTIGSLSPARTSAGTGTFTLTVSGGGFVPASEIRWNGISRSTTFVSSTQLRASIDGGEVAATGTAQVTVFSPAPGGGTSTALTFTIAPPPTLTVSTTTAAPGASVTVTLTNGLGGLYDWLSFAATTAPNTSYITFVYVGGGTTSRTWTVTMPSTPGTYEFRLFLNNGYARAATSPPVTVIQP
jgi:subtilisin family serine protease